MEPQKTESPQVENVVQQAQPTQPAQPQTQPKPNKKIWILGLLISLVVLLILGLAFFLIRPKASSSVKNSTPLVKSIMPDVSPTPFLFQEMTIPYLRTQKYESSIGPLSQSSSNASFTSYLTSYTSEGLKINAELTKPIGEIPAGGWPAIVFIHGYIPPTQYTTLGKYVDYVNYLARNGFVVLKIDLRGHGDSEGQAGGGYYSSDYVIDALNAAAALEKESYVNPAKIGFWGHSMAGNVVLRTVAARPNTPAAVIWAGAGYSYDDLQKYRIQDGSYQAPPNDSERQKKRQQLFETYGQFSSDSAFWKQVAATNYLSDLKTAIQLDHAVDDSVVNIGYSRDLNALLDKASLKHELNEYPSGNHNISGPLFVSAMNDTVRFFKENL